MATELQIDEEFKAMIPPLRDEELALLRSDILENGCLSAIVVWNGVIVDGHNRYAICREIGIPFKTVSIDFPDRDAAMWWIITNQIGRRNLTIIQAAYVRGKYWHLAKDVKTPSFNKKSGEKYLPDGTRTRQDLVGEVFGISGSALRNDYDAFKAIEKLSPTSRSYALSGCELLRKSHVIALSDLSHNDQNAVVNAVQEGKLPNLALAIKSLQGTRGGDSYDAPLVKCPSCGARLCRGVTTCLKCDLDDGDVQDALYSDAAPESGLPVDYEERLARVRETKQFDGNLSEAIVFYCGKLVRHLNGDRRISDEINHHAVKALKQCCRRISQLVDMNDGRPKLVGETSHDVAKRKEREGTC